MYQRFFFIGLAFLAAGLTDAQRTTTTTKSPYKVKDVKLNESYVNITAKISPPEAGQRSAMPSVKETMMTEMMRLLNMTFRAYKLFPNAYTAFEYPKNTSGFKGLTVNKGYSVGLSLENPPSNATYVTTTTPAPENATTTEAATTTTAMPRGAQQFPNSQRNMNASQDQQQGMMNGTQNGGQQQGSRGQQQRGSAGNAMSEEQGSTRQVGKEEVRQGGNKEVIQQGSRGKQQGSHQERQQGSRGQQGSQDNSQGSRLQQQFGQEQKRNYQNTQQQFPEVRHNTQSQQGQHQSRHPTFNQLPQSRDPKSPRQQNSGQQQSVQRQPETNRPNYLPPQNNHQDFHSVFQRSQQKSPFKNYQKPNNQNHDQGLTFPHFQRKIEKEITPDPVMYHHPSVPATPGVYKTTGLTTGRPSALGYHHTTSFQIPDRNILSTTFPLGGRTFQVITTRAPAHFIYASYSTIGKFEAESIPVANYKDADGYHYSSGRGLSFEEGLKS